MIHILTDSTADLSPELVDRYHIHVIPLTVTIAGQTYKDGINLHSKQLFELVERYHELPKTAAPAIPEILQAFDPQSPNLYIGLSSKLSATFQNVYLASQEWAQSPLRLIDSLNLSTGIGLLVLRAAELRDEGLDLEDIADQIAGMVPKVHTAFVVDTLDYLYMGGRCSAVENLVGSLLSIRPVIEVRPDGTLGVKNKLRGSRAKALEALLTDFQANLNELDRHRVFITHSGCDGDAEYLANQIQKMAAPDEILITTAGAVISSHCGPNTIGILYMTR